MVLSTPFLNLQKQNKGVFLIIKIRQILRSNFFFKNFNFLGSWISKNWVYISWKIQILTISRHKITQIFTKKYYLLSKFSKLHNLETHFCKLLRPRAPPFQKIKWNSWNLVTTLQKSCFLGPTIFEIPQPNWYYCTELCCWSRIFPWCSANWSILSSFNFPLKNPTKKIYKDIWITISIPGFSGIWDYLFSGFFTK